MKNKLVYIPIGVSTFHMPSAEALFKASIDCLKTIEPNLIYPERILFSTKDVENFMQDLNPDGIILQNVTFANAAYATTVFRFSKAPVLLWTLIEPSLENKRLALNSLTGAFSAAHAHKATHGGFLKHLIGNPDDEQTKKVIQTFVLALQTKRDLHELKIASIGHPPQGFGFGQAIDTEMANVFGAELITIESRELTNIAKKLDQETAEKAAVEAKSKMISLSSIPEENQNAFYKLYHVYRDFIKTNGIKAIASRCWPDFFTDYGTPVCSVLGLLNDQLIAAACEADVYGALSMYIGMSMSQKPTYLGDPVAIDSLENTITFWHCGTAACSLARQDTGALTGVHPNRKIGPTMEFGLKASQKATLFRVNRKPDGTFRFFIAKTEILDKPKQYLGTSLVAKLNHDVTKVVSKLLSEGLEPHMVLIYDDVYESLHILAQLLGLEIITDEVI
jgi:L-fucose isomerase-like protein